MDLALSLSSRLKRALPSDAKAALKRLLGRLDPLRIRGYRLRHNHSAPIPPRHLRVRVGGGGIHRFIEAGRHCAAAIESGIAQVRRPIESFHRALDFGCGCGRTMQHMRGRIEELYGCDVDADAIEWMQSQYGEMHFVPNRDVPPLPYSANFFDLVYSISVFTHLPEERQWEWLTELRRVINPGGLALLSIQGDHAYDLFRSGSLAISADLLGRLRAREDLAAERFVYEPYEIVEPDPGIVAWSKALGSYGLTFHDHGYIRERWNELFEVVAILPEIVDTLQDLVVLRRRA